MKKIIFILFLCFFSSSPFCTPLGEEPDLYINASGSVADPFNETLPTASRDLIYFMQSDPRWAEKNYGPQNCIAIYGCGPTVLSMLVSTFTEQVIQPDEMAQWCYQNGFFSPNSGSYHSVIPEGAKAWGLKSKVLTEPTYDAIRKELSNDRVIVLLMGKGHFTEGGHFLIVRNITLDGKLLLADPNSLGNSYTAWEPEFVLSQVKIGRETGCPVWSIGK